MLQLLSLMLGLVRVGLRSRADLVAENLLLRQQLAVLTRPERPRPRLRTRDTLLWVLARAIWRNWRRPLLLVATSGQPDRGDVLYPNRCPGCR